MFNDNLKWYFPASIPKAVNLIKQPGVILHGGGTRILKTQSKSIVGLVDIGSLKLNYIKHKKNQFNIGAAVTFNDIIKYSKDNNCLSMLGTSLSQAASTPLRNRITIGGSLKDFPLWSNLIAPLIALDAKIEINNGKPKLLAVEDYITSGIIKTKHLIKEIIVPQDESLTWQIRRFALLKFEYPLFNFVLALKIKDNLIKESRIVITGVKSRYKRFISAEKFLEGKFLSDNLIKQANRLIDPKFNSDYKYSSSYKNRIAKIYFNDMLKEIIGTSL